MAPYGQRLVNVLDSVSMEHFCHPRKFFWTEGLERKSPFDCCPIQWKINYETFIASCKVSPDGKYVVSALDVDRAICIMDAENTTTVSYIKSEFAGAPCSVLSAAVPATCLLTNSDFQWPYLLRL